jgi:hypothetical protein
VSVYVHTNRALSRLANLTCALEDCQAFAESGETELLLRSAQIARENATAIRDALDQIERQLPTTEDVAVA